MSKCPRKRPYLSQEDANKEIARLPPKPRLKAYRCGDHWHVGHKKRPNRTPTGDQQGAWLLSRGRWTSEGRPRLED